MAFTKKTWKDYPDTSTLVTATELERIETGIANAHTLMPNVVTAGPSRVSGGKLHLFTSSGDPGTAAQPGDLWIGDIV